MANRKRNIMVRFRVTPEEKALMQQKQELAGIEHAILAGVPLMGELQKHEAWVKELMDKQMFTPETTASILKMEVGKVFAQVLEHAGVFKRNPEGAAAFDRFVASVNDGEK